MAPFEKSALAEWSPRINVSETEKEIQVTAELPGIEEKDVEVTLDNGVLLIKGEKKAEKEEKNKNYHRVERSYGAFTRSFTLPQTVSGEEAQAEYNNGVLRVTLPKREEAKSRRIEITGGSRPTSKTIDTTADTSKAKASSGS
jgi:HSP20 family protein